MGGYGSGRSTCNLKAEDCRSLEVSSLHREGCLRAGQRGGWVWSREGQEVGRIGYTSTASSLILDYRVRQHGGEWEPITQTVPFTYVQCHYGGQRPYFLCPGVVSGQHCRRRVGKLFAGGTYFLCRHCYNVSYSSQSEAQYDRLLRRANKLRIALGGEPGSASWIAERPKGMWHRTYQRKRLEIDWCEQKANHLFIERFAHVLSPEERRMYFDELM